MNNGAPSKMNKAMIDLYRLLLNGGITEQEFNILMKSEEDKYVKGRNGYNLQEITEIY